MIRLRARRILAAGLALGTALAAAASAPDVLRTTGELVRVDGTTLVIRPRSPGATHPSEEPDVKIIPIADTTLILDGRPTTPAELTPRMLVDAVLFPAAGQRAARMFISVTTPSITCEVLKIDGPTLTVRVTGGLRRGEVVNVTTDDHPRVRLSRLRSNGRPDYPADGTMDDVAVGDRVIVKPDAGPVNDILVTRKSGAATTRP